MINHIRRAVVASIVACIVTGTAVATSPSVAGAAPTPPGAPTITQATPIHHGVSLQFDPPSDTGGSANVSYAATCASTDGGIGNGAPGVSSPIVVTGLTDGATYSCTIAASNEAGPGPDSAPSDPVVPLAITAPGAPTVTGVVPGDTTAAVSLDPPADDGGAPIVLYTVNCSSNDGGAPANAGGIAIPITVNGLTNSHTYTCNATATNSAGPGSPSADSAPFSVGPPPPPPGPPPPTGAISGTVTATPPADLSTYCAQVTIAGTSNMIGNAPIAADGTYTLNGLGTGSYDVRFVDCTGGGDYLPQWYGGVPFTPRDDPVRDGAVDVSVTDGATTSAIDGILSRGAHVKGTVTAAVGGAPLPNICVVTADSDPNAITQTRAGRHLRPRQPAGHMAARVLRLLQLALHHRVLEPHTPFVERDEAAHS